MDILFYNQYLSECFEKAPSADVLSKYVMSETLPPIADYSNAINLIRANYPAYSDTALLIVGAYLLSTWFPGNNDLLGILNNQIGQLSKLEQSIVYYLNAHHLRRTDKLFYNNPRYLENLLKSTEIEVPFVSNFLYLSEVLLDEKSSRWALDRAAANIKKVYCKDEIMQMTIEHFLTPQSFVEEFVLQTHIPYVRFESIRQRYFNVVDSVNEGAADA